LLAKIISGCPNGVCPMRNICKKEQGTPYPVKQEWEIRRFGLIYLTNNCVHIHMPQKCTVRVIIIYPFAKGFQFNLIYTFSFTLFPFVFNYSISIICFNYSISILTVRFLEVVNIFVLYALINWPSWKTLIPEILFPTIWSYNSELQFDLKRCKLDHILVKTPYPWYFLPLRWMSKPISMPRSHWQSININLVDTELYLQTRKPSNTLQPHVFRCHTYC
jgi:hypothetical protein